MLKNNLIATIELRNVKLIQIVINDISNNNNNNCSYNNNNNYYVTC